MQSAAATYRKLAALKPLRVREPPESKSDIVARRVRQDQAVRVSSPHPRRFTQLAGLRGQPSRPFRPPRPLELWSSLQPLVGADIGECLPLSSDLIEMTWLVGRRHDARIVAAAGQKICDVSFNLIVDLVGRFPGRHVIAEGSRPQTSVREYRTARSAYLRRRSGLRPDRY